MKNFEIKTKTKFGTYVYLTKANNGKEALNNLILNSADFNQLVGKDESNGMKISIEKY